MSRKRSARAKRKLIERRARITHSQQRRREYNLANPSFAEQERLERIAAYRADNGGHLPSYAQHDRHVSERLRHEAESARIA